MRAYYSSEILGTQATGRLDGCFGMEIWGRGCCKDEMNTEWVVVGMMVVGLFGLMVRFSGLVCVVGKLVLLRGAECLQCCIPAR